VAGGIGIGLGPRKLLIKSTYVIMKKNKTILPLFLAGLALLISVAGKITDSPDKNKKSDKIKHMKKNNVTGTWSLISGYLDNHGTHIDILGPHPAGMLIFTEDLYFIVIVHNPDIPKFASGDRANATPEEYKTAVTNSLGVYGTYTIDEKGEFGEEHVLGSTFQNMNGHTRGRNEITVKVEGNRLTEIQKIADGIAVHLEWDRAK
jgi:Lipocalin-like domain